jgi:hypothetical protein
MTAQQRPVRTLMNCVSWIGLLACAVAGLGYLAAGVYNMAGLMIALAALSWINIRRKGKDDRDRPRLPR